MASKFYNSGDSPGGGVYVCTVCETALKLGKYDTVPNCPNCRNSEFKKTE